MSKLCSEMADQEVFDTVVTHLLTQNERAMVGNSCVYRRVHPHKGKVLKCAIGCLIPDELYDPDLEKRLVYETDVLFALGYSDDMDITITDRRLELLSSLQTIHDTEPLPFWRETLGETAKHFKLKFNPPAQEKNDGPHENDATEA